MGNVAILVAVLTSVVGQTSRDIHVNAETRGKQIVVEVKDQFGNEVMDAEVQIMDSNKTRTIVPGSRSDLHGKATFLIPEPAFSDYYVVTATKNNFRPGETEVRWKIDSSFPVQLWSRGQLTQAAPVPGCWPCCTPCCRPCCTPCYRNCDPCGADLCPGSLLCSGSTQHVRDVASNIGSASLDIAVPQDAVVFINNRRTTSKGISRSYVSIGLEEGVAYKYVVRVQVMRDGKVVEDARELILHVNESKNLAFQFSNKGRPEYASVQ